MAIQSFPLGNVVITPNAFGQLTPADIQRGLQRHQAGDWGNLGEADWLEMTTQLKLDCGCSQVTAVPAE